MATIRERLDEFFRRLAAAPAARAASDALELIRRLLDEVEDEWSEVPKLTPPPPRRVNDGRMYPPQEDSIVRLPDGGLIAYPRQHTIFIGAGGSITIVYSGTGSVEFTKPGAEP